MLLATDACSIVGFREIAKSTLQEYGQLWTTMMATVGPNLYMIQLCKKKLTKLIENNRLYDK